MNFSLSALLLASLSSSAAGQIRDTVRLVLPDTIVAKASADSTRKALRLCSAGDVTLGSNLDSLWERTAAVALWERYARRADPDSLLAPLQNLFADADVVLLNVEGAIGDGPFMKKCGPRSTSCYAFRSPTSAAGAIRRVGSDKARVIGNVANNHSHDVGGPGLSTTIALLDSAGVQVTGADTMATMVTTSRGDTLAFLCFYTGSDSPDARNLAGVRRHVARAVASYRTVIVTMHLGAEGASAQRTRNMSEVFVGTQRGNPVAFANAALDGGATAVIGHGPHVLRGGEWRDSSLVLYSLGNFVNYGTFRLTEPMNRGAVACLDILGPRRIGSATLASTIQIAPGVVLWDWNARSASLIDSLSRLDFPQTGILVAPDGTIGRRGVSAPPARRQ
ncbi:MAG: CapA family protein [Gemmatimonadaceae bacterium]